MWRLSSRGRNVSLRGWRRFFLWLCAMLIGVREQRCGGVQEARVGCGKVVGVL